MSGTNVIFGERTNYIMYCFLYTRLVCFSSFLACCVYHYSWKPLCVPQCKAIRLSLFMKTIVVYLSVKPSGDKKIMCAFNSQYGSVSWLPARNPCTIWAVFSINETCHIIDVRNVMTMVLSCIDICIGKRIVWWHAYHWKDVSLVNQLACKSHLVRDKEWQTCYQD